MNIIGISAFYHDASCCLLRNGQLVAAASEERFSRLKHDAGLPAQAFRYCLEKGGLDITDIDIVAFYENPDKKRERQLWSGRIEQPDAALVPDVESILRERLGFECPVLFFDHHLSHAASAFYFSGFEDAAIFTVDGVGEWTTTAYGTGRGNSIELFEEVSFPHSIGLLYAAITAYLGFRVNDGEYKVMGLAAYGKPRYVPEIEHLIASTSSGGQFQLNLLYFDFIKGPTMYSQRLCELLGAPARIPDSEITTFHQDIAASLQTVVETLLLKKAVWLKNQTGLPNLCMAGGVALNGVAMGRIHRESGFEDLFVPPSPGDGGAALGAAALAHVQLTGERPNASRMKKNDLGPSFTNQEIRHFIHGTGLNFEDFENNQDALLELIVNRLMKNQVIGWFQGGMEFGPRALGGRSILANPMDPDIRQRLNRMVKKREDFRPFAPSVLEKFASTHFDLSYASPFMLETCQVISPLDLPGITHIDGSARPQTVNREQNPLFFKLLEGFSKETGCPMLVNTSFNVADEPIVCSPSDALFCAMEAGLDGLVLGSFFIDCALFPRALVSLAAGWQRGPRLVGVERKSPLGENLYTFV